MTDPQLFADLAQLAVKSWEPYLDRPTAVNGHIVNFRAPFMAQVGKAIVTNYDCSECGDHDDCGCRHLDAMLEAYQRLRCEILAERESPLPPQPWKPRRPENYRLGVKRPYWTGDLESL